MGVCKEVPTKAGIPGLLFLMQVLFDHLDKLIVIDRFGQQIVDSTAQNVLLFRLDRMSSQSQDR